MTESGTFPKKVREGAEYCPNSRTPGTVPLASPAGDLRDVMLVSAPRFCCTYADRSWKVMSEKIPGYQFELYFNEQHVITVFWSFIKLC